MKKITLDKFVEKRLKENKKKFTKEEWEIIKDYPQMVKKIYLLGFINEKNVMKKENRIGVPKGTRTSIARLGGGCSILLSYKHIFNRKK